MTSLRMPFAVRRPVLTCLLSLAACNAVHQDEFLSAGGQSPDPSGIVSGSVVYVGPRPVCEYAGDSPSRVIGQVVLLMFAYDNPPPPEGTADTGNLLVIPGEELFGLSDCVRPDSQPSAPITRTAPFRWPSIERHPTEPVSYQIRGFYDADGDVVPFFSIKNLPTAGDIAGAALTEITDPGRGLLRITFPPRTRARDGFLVENVAVALGNQVRTERPLFKPSQNRVLSAEATITPVVNGLVPDQRATLQNVWNLSCENANGNELEGPMRSDESCGFSFSTLTENEIGAQLSAAKVGHAFDPERYAFFVEPVDVKTVRVGAPDLLLADGKQDPHPVFGASLGLSWWTPMVFVRRTALPVIQPAGTTEIFEEDIELRANIPGVVLVGSVLPQAIQPDAMGPVQRTFTSELPAAVPPVAIVSLDRVDPACRVLYVPKGNPASTFEARVAECRDLPAGAYTVNLLSGIAGGDVQAESDPALSDNGVIIEDGIYSGQAWSVPNELGDPLEVGARNVADSQNDAFLVYDPNPEVDQGDDCTTGADFPGAPTRELNFRGKCAPGEEPLAEDMLGLEGTSCLPDYCCERVAHLCDVPLCDWVEVEGRKIRASPSRIVRQTADGSGVPNCMPFALPRLCCGP
jgi:hypothetical protein